MRSDARPDPDATQLLAVLRRRIRDIDRLVLDVVGRVADAQVTEPSPLPGWTRGHVLAHIAGTGAAAARQIEVAVADGDLLDYYDGGVAGRNAAIEALAGDSASEHIARVTETVRRFEAAADAVTPRVLGRVTGVRGRPVSGVLEMWWREAGVHVADLDLGVDHTAWDAELCEHLFGYLESRVRPGTQLELVAEGDRRRMLGAGGDRVTVRGPATALAAWLAGRDVTGVDAERDGEPAALPELGPWP